MRKVGKEGLKQIRSQVVRLKKMGKSGKEIEELVGVRQNRISEIWTAYQREGEASLERKKYGRKPGTHMLLEAWEQGEIREVVVEKTPEDFGIPGKLWTQAVGIYEALGAELPASGEARPETGSHAYLRVEN